MTNFRKIEKLDVLAMRGVTPAPISEVYPSFEWADPASLLIEESYQRDILGNGVALIRKIVADFSWACFKPPICVRLEGGALVCIDGQHTATACATHPSIEEIPVMVVDASAAADRAKAFVGHNKNRLNLTAQVIFHAELAAGDPTAVEVNAALMAAGCSIPRKPISLDMKLPPGTTIAVGTVKAIVERQGRRALERVMRILMAAGRAVIRADEIAAVAVICSAGFLTGDEALSALIASRSAEAWAGAARSASADTKMTLALALATIWCAELGFPMPSRKGSSRDPTTVVPRVQTPPKKRKLTPPPPKPATPSGAPAPQKVAPPPPKPAAPASAANGRPPGAPETFTRNGVRVNATTTAVTHRGRTVNLRNEIGVRLVIALATVMPAMLDFDRLATRVFKRRSSDPSFELGQLIAEIAPALRSVRLEVKTVPKMGNTLFDLGPETG